MRLLATYRIADLNAGSLHRVELLQQALEQAREPEPSGLGGRLLEEGEDDEEEEGDDDEEHEVEEA